LLLDMLTSNVLNANVHSYTNLRCYRVKWLRSVVQVKRYRRNTERAWRGIWILPLVYGVIDYIDTLGRAKW